MDWTKIGVDVLSVRNANIDFESVGFSDGATGIIVKIKRNVGWSVCTPEDQEDYDFAKGIGLAAARADLKVGFSNVPERYYKKIREAADAL